MHQTLAFVTGANTGIGEAIAKSLAEDHGYHVLIGCRSLPAGEKVAHELTSAGYTATAIQLDLTSPSSIENAVATIQKDYGSLDVLVNNAGILLDYDSSQTKWDLYTKTMTTNVVGMGVLTESLVPLLRTAKSGVPRVVFVSSIMGSLHTATDKTVPWYPIEYKVYDASKAATNMLMLNFARVLDDVGAKVNAACPGLVRSKLTRYMEAGDEPATGAIRAVQLATLGPDGPTATFSNRFGPLAF